MRTVRWNPVREAMALSRAMEDMFNESAVDTRRAPARPPMDIVEHENHVEVIFSLPGIAPEDVNIEIKDNVLTVSTEVNTHDTHENASYTYRERYQGSYQRSLRLPENLNGEGAEARYDNGVLVLTLPRIPEAEPIKIAVKGANKTIESGKKK